MKTKNIIQTLFLLLLIISCSGNQKRTIASEKKVRLFLAIDGLGHNIFEFAKKEYGLFSQFNEYGVHIAPFPAISGYSWNSVMGSRKVNGELGRFKNFESVYYNEYTKRIDSDPRNTFIDWSNPNLFPSAFPIQYNRYLETMGYKSPDYIRREELKSIENQIINTDGPLISAYIACFDGVAHLHTGAMKRSLIEMNEMIERVYENFKKREIDLEIILVSDHGQAARFEESKKEVPLLPVDITKTLKEAGLTVSKKLSKDTDAMPAILALANYVPITFKDRRKITQYVQSLKSKNWFSLAVYRPIFQSIEEAIDQKQVNKVIVESSTGKAEIIFQNDLSSMRYEPIEGGNPLEIDKKYHNSWLNLEESLEATLNTRFPDSLYRISNMESRNEINSPDLIITLQNEYRTNSGFGSMVQMNRTHGNLQGSGSFGIVASNNPALKIPKYIRSENILSFLGHEPIEFFKLSDKDFEKISRDELIEEHLKSQNKNISTGVDNLNDFKNTVYLTKAIELSKFVFEINNIGEVFTLGEKPGHLSEEFGFREIKLNETKKIKSSNVNLLSDEVVIDSKSKFSRLKNKIIDSTKKIQKKIATIGDKASLSLKRLLMISYSLKSQLKSFGQKPKLEEVKNNRDIQKAQIWGKYRDQFSIHQSNAKEVLSDLNLFGEIFKEKQLESKIEPKILPLYYDKLPKKNLTIVYVPGIYDAIFDGLLFARAIYDLQNKKGMRVIRMEVESSCSSQVNGKLIMKQLKEDTKERILRGHDRPNYLFLSYSKGAIDTLHAFLEDRDFIKENVLGMVSIAAPLKGSAIANKADLSQILVEALTSKNVPRICKKEEKAIDSLKESYLSKFWLENTEVLKGLTPYFSISFSSKAFESHLWMKATKAILNSKEENDGVVEISASKFPREMMAFDLGTFQGDHLAGRVSGEFDQKSFFRTIVTFLGEINIL